MMGIGKNRKALLCLIGLALFFIFGLKNHYRDLYRITGSARHDLMEALEKREGACYEKRRIASSETEQGTLELLEDQTIELKKESVSSWQKHMPETDEAGAPLSRRSKISVYSCRVKLRRYLALNGQPLPDQETCKFIEYKGYEDTDLDSRAMAVLDDSSRTVSYSDSGLYFEDEEAQLQWQ